MIEPRKGFKFYNADWLTNDLPDKSVNLLIADPPYFKVKGDFDFKWQTFEDYLQDVEIWAKECKRLLADNGTLFWWGSAKRIAYSQVIFDKYFNLVNSLVWRKPDSIQMAYYSPDLARSFNTHNERLLMYSNETDEDDNYFKSIKEYLRNEKTKSGLSNKDYNLLFSKYTNKNGRIDRSVIEHYWAKSQWVFPTENIYKNVLQKTGVFKKEYEELRKEYEELRKEYEELRRPFYNPNKYEEVLTFSKESNISKDYDHETIKPEKLTRALILTCSRPNDLVFVPFAGSGTECAMAVRENRKFMGYEIDEKYYKIAKARIEKELEKKKQLCLILNK